MKKKKRSHFILQGKTSDFERHHQLFHFSKIFINSEFCVDSEQGRRTEKKFAPKFCIKISKVVCWSTLVLSCSFLLFSALIELLNSSKIEKRSWPEVLPVWKSPSSCTVYDSLSSELILHKDFRALMICMNT